MKLPLILLLVWVLLLELDQLSSYENEVKAIRCGSHDKSEEELVHLINPPLTPQLYSSNRIQRKNKRDEFKLIRLLGTGTFSKVVLVKQIASNKFFAMKVMEKAFLIKVILLYYSFK
jgi:hypothetical protein